MSHHIYKTRAVILGSRNSGEANRLFFLLTEELGFIVALAQGVRNLKSKLKHSLSDFNLIGAELVRGREVWRITSVETAKNYSKIFLSDELKIKSVGRIFSVLRRLVHGESKNRELFADIADFLDFLEKEKLNRDEVVLSEIFMNLKILNRLGYGSPDEILKNITKDKLTKETIGLLALSRKKAVMEINRAFRESHL